MDGKYLASNIGPLKTIGDGKVFVTIYNLLNSRRFENVSLVAYSIEGTESRLITVDCLFKKANKHGSTLHFRSFDFHKNIEIVCDCLNLTAEHGIGFGDFDLHYFNELRNFYLDKEKSDD